MRVPLLEAPPPSLWKEPSRTYYCLIYCLFCSKGHFMLNASWLHCILPEKKSRNERQDGKLPGIRRNMGVISSWCQLTHCWQIRLLGPLLLSAAPRHRRGILGRLVWTIHHLPYCEKASSQSIKLHMLSRNLRCMRSHNGCLWGHGGGVTEPERRVWCHRKHYHWLLDCFIKHHNKDNSN